MHSIHFYDSKLFYPPGIEQLAFMKVRYPKKKYFPMQELQHKQEDFRSCGPYALANAFSCFLKLHPEDIAYKVNRIVGDESIYLRTWLLNVFESGLVSACPRTN